MAARLKRLRLRENKIRKNERIREGERSRLEEAEEKMKIELIGGVREKGEI